MNTSDARDAKKIKPETLMASNEIKVLEVYNEGGVVKTNNLKLHCNYTFPCL